jgi:CheY-like chemotaxis protein
MAVKILLADKSITIQKVVEMLFSGKEFEVTSAGDGESALIEADRIVPDVVLADVDLPRIDGYTFAARLRQKPKFAATPVILMLSRDDAFDAGKGRNAGILDHIQKPFESQELIGKVKKAVSVAPPRMAEPAPRTAAAPAAAAPPPRQAPAAPKPKSSVPSDIFDIIKEAPSQADLKRPAPAAEGLFEVEPVVEVQESFPREAERVLPVGERAVEEIRAGLGLGAAAPPEITSFDTLDTAAKSAREYAPPSRPQPSAPAAGPAVSEDMLRGVAEETVTRIARDVLEKVAWEIIPDMAERMIREEIERLKSGL